MKKVILYIVVMFIINFGINLFLNLHAAEHHDFFSKGNIFRAVIISAILVAANLLFVKITNSKKNKAA